MDLDFDKNVRESGMTVHRTPPLNDRQKMHTKKHGQPRMVNEAMADEQLSLHPRRFVGPRGAGETQVGRCAVVFLHRLP
jgi:hypothetical protein